LVHDRVRIKSQISDLAYLGEKTDGLWLGLETYLDEVNRAAEFAVLLERTIPSFRHTADDVSATLAGIERLCRSTAGGDALREAGAAFAAACSALAAAIKRMVQSGRIVADQKVVFERVGVDELQKQCGGHCCCCSTSAAMVFLGRCSGRSTSIRAWRIRLRTGEGLDQSRRIATSVRSQLQPLVAGPCGYYGCGTQDLCFSRTRKTDCGLSSAR
jgi:hypothetical protein